MAECDTRTESGQPSCCSFGGIILVGRIVISSTIDETPTEGHNHAMYVQKSHNCYFRPGDGQRGFWEQSGSATVDCTGSDWSLAIVDFSHRNQTGCLKDPHQQSTKPRKMKNMNHKVSRTPKNIRIGSLSMILGPFEHHHKSNPNY